jgi:type VI secretion system VasD/TssJ family lipoprotein
LARNLWLVPAFLWLGLVGAGCATTCKTPPPFYVTLEAADDLNQKFATRVLILQLTELEALAAADFNELRKNPAGVLGEALVGTPEEMVVNPGEAETRWVARDKDAQFVTAVAIFQNPETWNASHKLEKVPALMCREVPLSQVVDRRPWPSEEQVRFYLRGSNIQWEAASSSRRADAAPPGEPTAYRTGPRCQEGRGNGA